ncbi:MAG: hypothetical protein ACM3ZB_02100 [bacterium]|jgi:hypothetical protein
MSLFTDGPAATIAALQEYESSILDVAATEGIDLAVKLNVAHRETGIDLQRFLEEHGGASLRNVVVTEPLATWETFRALVLTFRDAYHNQMNDRYQPKWKEYERRAAWAADVLFQLGVGITWNPVPKAERPALTAGSGDLAAATYYVRITWVGASGEEGAPSEMAVISVPDASTVTVRAGAVPAGVQGWNVYAGYDSSSIMLQTDTPVAAGATWTVPATGLRNGRPPDAGQAPQTMLKRVFRF